MVRNKMLMTKLLKYIVVIAVIALLGYNSVYIKKLSDVTGGGSNKFDAAAFSRKLWNGPMSAKMDSAVDLSYLIAAVTADKDSAFKRLTHALDIGNYRYTFIKAQATVTAVKEDEVMVQIPDADSVMNDILATEYIYGNAIRDASGLLDLRDFPNTMNLNRVSEEINKIVRTTVLPPFKKAVRKGDKVDVTAAVQLNMEHVKWDGLELIPVRLQIVN